GNVIFLYFCGLFKKEKQHMLRWFLVILGYIIFRFPGAVIGYLIGSLLESNSRRPSFNPYQSSRQVTPADFELNLLSLASLVIKADGKVSQTELDYVRMYFVQAYGKERANANFRLFNEVIKKREVSAVKI